MSEYTILVIEDEKHTREGFLRILHEYDTVTSLSASSAEIALQLLKQHQVDAMLLDIKLPDKNGIELLNAIPSERQPITVIISGFDSFEYAQKALGHRVLDYLLKPLTPKRVRDTIDFLLSRLGEQAKKVEQYSKLKQKALQARMYLEKEFLELIFSSRSSFQDIRKLADELVVDTSKSFYRLILITFDYRDCQEITGDHEFTQLVNIARSQTDLRQIYILVYGHDAIIIIQHETTLVGDSWHHQTLYKLNRKLQKEVSCKLNMGIGAWVHGFEEIHRSYVLACQDLAIQNNYIVRSMTGLPLVAESEYTSIQEYETLLRTLDLTQNSKVISSIIDKIYKSDIHKTTSVVRYIDVLLMIMSEYEIPISPEFETLLNKALKSIHIHSYFNLQKVLTSLLKEAFKLIGESRAESNSLVRSVKSYIREHYYEDITISIIAEHISYSPNYISTVFKQVTGYSVIDFLHDTRIAAAKSLLRHTTFHMQEIAERVGYRDQYYFSKIFKKYTGMTALTFRNS